MQSVNPSNRQDHLRRMFDVIYSRPPHDCSSAVSCHGPDHAKRKHAVPQTLLTLQKLDQLEVRDTELQYHQSRNRECSRSASSQEIFFHLPPHSTRSLVLSCTILMVEQRPQVCRPPCAPRSQWVLVPNAGRYTLARSAGTYPLVSETSAVQPSHNEARLLNPEPTGSTSS